MSSNERHAVRVTRQMPQRVPAIGEPAGFDR
jgi:hypothetical protein